MSGFVGDVEKPALVRVIWAKIVVVILILISVIIESIRVVTLEFPLNAVDVLEIVIKFVAIIIVIVLIVVERRMRF